MIMETNEEYVLEHLAEMLAAYAKFYQLDEADFVHGKGRHKTIRQRHYECLQAYMRKLEEYRKKLTVCGDERNSYARTDHSATFMRLKGTTWATTSCCRHTTYKSAWRMSISPWRTSTTTAPIWIASCR